MIYFYTKITIIYQKLHSFFSHVCEKCFKKFARKHQLNKHCKTFHDKVFNNKIQCELCQKVFDDLFSFKTHIKLTHQSNLNFKKIKSVFDDKNVIYRKYYAEKQSLLHDIVNKKSEVEEISETIYTYLLTHPFVKFSIAICYRKIIF